MWKPHEVRNKLENLKDKFHFRLPQMQTLLCQERFLLRLYQFKKGKSYIWKGGSLLVRMYQPCHQKPRFTVDLDLEAWKVNVLRTEELFKRAMAVDLKDGFQFFELKKEPMKRHTPYGGERFSIEWSLFDKNQSEALKIDVCSGDFIEPETVKAREICLIQDTGNISFLVYPPEFIFAEKLETVLRFGTGNTRVKDFIDLDALIKKGINTKKLERAVRECFKRRGKDFQIRELLRVLNDKDFIEFLGEFVKNKKEYERLHLPNVASILENIKNKVAKL